MRCLRNGEGAYPHLCTAAAVVAAAAAADDDDDDDDDDLLHGFLCVLVSTDAVVAAVLLL